MAVCCNHTNYYTIINIWVVKSTNFRFISLEDRLRFKELVLKIELHENQNTRISYLIVHPRYKLWEIIDDCKLRKICISNGKE